MKRIRKKMKQANIKKIKVRMIIRARKRLQARLKRKKNHVMVMLVCINVENTSADQFMNMHAQQRLYPSVKWKILCQSKNLNMKTCENILSFIINNCKDVLRIWNRALRVLKTLQALLMVFPSIVLV